MNKYKYYKMCENCASKMKPVYKNMSRREQTMFYRCPQCKLIWTSKQGVDISFQSKLDENSRRMALKNIRSREFAQVNGLVRKYVPRGGFGLDVGCSYGWYMESVGKYCKMEGIEPEDAIASKARADGHKVYTGFFPEHMPGDGKIYDFIVFNNVWEHINGVSELIKESTAFIQTGGYLFITVPLSTGGLYRISELFERIGRTKELARLWQLHFHSPHIYYYSKRNFVQLMEKYNFILKECLDVRGIDLKRMRERFEMDADERHAKMKAGLFQIVYPFLRRLPADKALFVFQYNG